MGYNYQDALRESQQEYFGKVHTDNTETLNNALKRIEDLEKENAELQETLKTYNGCGDWDNDFHTCRVYLQHEELQMYINQLTEAKHLISEWLRLHNSNTKKTIIKKSEAFLKGSKE